MSSAVYSGGPNLRARRASGGATNVNATTLRVPAMNDATAAIASAAPARPRCAMACPSIHVMTDEASPGIRSRMEVVEPPYWEP